MTLQYRYLFLQTVSDIMESALKDNYQVVKRQRPNDRAYAVHSSLEIRDLSFAQSCRQESPCLEIAREKSRDCKRRLHNA